MYQCKTVTYPGNRTVVPARERIKFLKEEGIDYELSTDHGEDAHGNLICKCELKIFTHYPTGPTVRSFTGTSAAPLTEEFAYETTETKAIGRALASFGIGIDDSYASAEEFEGTMKTKVMDIDALPKQEMKEAINASVQRGETLTANATKRVRGKAAKEETLEPVILAPVEDGPGEEQPMDITGEPIVHPVAEEVKPAELEVDELPVKPIVIEKPKQAKFEDEDLPPAKSAIKPSEKFSEATPVEISGNKYGIKIEERNDKGVRPWKVVIPINTAIEKAGLTMDMVSSEIKKLFPEYEKWEDEDILGGALTEHLHTALNNCKPSK